MLLPDPLPPLKGKAQQQSQHYAQETPGTNCPATTDGLSWLVRRLCLGCRVCFWLADAARISNTPVYSIIRIVGASVFNGQLHTPVSRIESRPECLAARRWTHPFGSRR
jgi:hypothetical protein